MEFISGQKLTAADLNSVIQLAQGQNVPTDGSYIKTNQGVNYYSNMAAKPDDVKRPQVFNVGIRYHNIESDNDKDPVYLPFWYIYLGKDSNQFAIDLNVSSLKVNAGHGLKMSDVTTIYVQPMPPYNEIKFEKLKDFEYKNAVVQFANCDSDPNNLKTFDPSKIVENEPLQVNSDGDGWFCTGLPASENNDEGFEWTKKLLSKEIYATFVRISLLGARKTYEYDIALVITNASINNVSQLFLNDNNVMSLFDNNYEYCELLGGHSQKIASLDLIRSTGSTILLTNMYPSDHMKKDFDKWELVVPSFVHSEAADKDQVNKYEFVNTIFIDYDGVLSDFVEGEDDEDTDFTHIIFSKLEETTTPIGLYYAAIENDRDYDKDELNIYRLKKYAVKSAIVDILMADLSLARSSINEFALAATQDAYRRMEEKPTLRIVPICAFLVNKNNNKDDPNLWSIEHISYIDRLPDFGNTLYDTSSSELMYKDEDERLHCSLESTDVILHSDTVPKIATTYDQLYRFNENDYKLTSLNDLSAEVVVRQHSSINGTPADIINYVDLSTILSGISELSGTSCSADSEIESLNLSSIGVLSNDEGKVYELYNFDKMNTDINSRIMTLGGLNFDRHGKVGKLIDADGNVLTAIDIVVRDKDTHEIKYMNLSVDETLVDTYVGGAGGSDSISYTENWAGQCYLNLYGFNGYNPNAYLDCILSSNGLHTFGTDGGQDGTYVLCKNYVNNRWVLEYKKLRIDCNLSGGGEVSSISGDTNVIGTRKSIDTKTESGKTFHQLHNFDNPAPTTKTVDMQAKNTAYDTLDSNEYFVIKSGNEVKYKKVQIKDNTPGGGGTSGYTGSVVGDCRLKWNTRGTYKIELWGKDMTYENGLLKTVGDERLVSELDTVGYSGQ